MTTNPSQRYTTAYFPIFPSSCYAPHYSALPYIPLELLRSPLQRTSLYSPRAASLPTTTSSPIFPSNRTTIMFTGILVVTIYTNFPPVSAGFLLDVIYTLKMEAIFFTESSLFLRTTRCCNPGDHNLLQINKL
jgi:hypothetical protein